MAIFVKIAPLFSHVRVQNRRMIDFKGLRDDLIQKWLTQNAFYLSKMAIFVKIAPNGECSTGRNAFYLRKMAIFMKIAPLFSHVRVQNRQMIDFKGLPDGRKQSQHRPPPPRRHILTSRNFRVHGPRARTEIGPVYPCRRRNHHPLAPTKRES